jgi:hypothetical protein
VLLVAIFFFFHLHQFYYWKSLDRIYGTGDSRIKTSTRIFTASEYYCKRKHNDGTALLDSHDYPREM